MANNKHNQLKRQYSLDGGLTWQDLLPMVYKVGNITETNSSCTDKDGCRWRILPLTVDFDCDSNYNMYQVEIEECLNDDGVFVPSGERRRYQLIETYSTACGYTGPFCTPSTRDEYSYTIEYNGGAVEYNQYATPVVYQITTTIETDKGCREYVKSTKTKQIEDYSITYSPDDYNYTEEERTVTATVSYSGSVIGSFDYIQKSHLYECGETISFEFTTYDGTGVHYYLNNMEFYADETNSTYNGSAYIHTKTLSELGIEKLTSLDNCFGNINTKRLLKVLKFPCTKDVLTMSGMFEECDYLTEIKDIALWDVSNVRNTEHMFLNCSSLISLDLSRWNVNKLVQADSMFRFCSAEVNISNWDLSQITLGNFANSNTMIMNNCNFASIQYIKTENNKTNIITNQEFTFEPIDGTITVVLPIDAKYTVIINGNESYKLTNPIDNGNGTYTYSTTLSNLGIDTCTSASSMFRHYYGGTELEIISTPISKNTFAMDLAFQNDTIESFDCLKLNDTSNIRRAINCFPVGCSLTNVDKINSSNIRTMEHMFAGCNLISHEIENFDVSNSRNLHSMLGRVDSNSLDLSGWNTSNVCDMNLLFSACGNLTSLNVSTWDTSNVYDMGYMFQDCSGLTSLDLSSFDTSNVTDMNGMFRNCKNLTSIDLTHFNTSSVKRMEEVFAGCSNLSSLDLSSWDVTNVKFMNNLFASCTSLEVLNVTNWNISKIKLLLPNYFYLNMFGMCKNLSNLILGEVSQETYDWWYARLTDASIQNQVTIDCTII